MLSRYGRRFRSPVSLFMAAVVFISGALSGCGGGGGGSSNAEGQLSETLSIPDQTGIQIKTITGKVDFPANSQALRESIVNTSFGSNAVASDASFSIPVNVQGVQLVSVNNPQGSAEFVGMAGITTDQTSIQLNAHSTAVALVFLNPFLASDDPPTAQRIGALIEGLPNLTAVETVVSGQIASKGALDFTDQNLISTIEAAVQSAINQLQGGGVPSIQPHAVSPTTQQSKLLIQTTSDSDSANITLDVQNFGLRYIELWGQAIDNNGNAVGQEKDLGIVQSADDFSIGSIPGAIVTGEVFGASHTPLSVAIPSGATAFQVKAWGPGVNNFSSVSSSDFAMHASKAALTTAIVNLAGPVIDSFVGVKVLTRGRGRPTDLFRLVEKLLDAQEGKKIAEELSEHPIRASWDTLSFLLKNSEGQQFLFDLAKSAGISGVTKVLLKKAGLLLSIAGIGFDAINGAAALGSIGASKPLEIYTVTPGITDRGNLFTVTLTWDQADDVDLHTFAPDGTHSFFSNKQIASGFLDTDNTAGFGPEHFAATSLLPGTYRIAVDYYRGDAPTNVRIRVTTAQGDQDFGPYEFVTADRDVNYPVKNNTESWWRPCDIKVNTDGTVEVLPPDLTSSLAQLIPRGVSMQKR